MLPSLHIIHLQIVFCNCILFVLVDLFCDLIILSGQFVKSIFLFAQVGMEHNVDGALRKGTSLQERVKSYRHRWLEDSLTPEFQKHGGKAKWKREQIQRFFVGKEKKVSAEDVLFQLAWLSPSVFAKLLRVFELYEEGKTKGQKVMPVKTLSAHGQVVAFTKKKELANTGFLGFTALDVDTQLRCLDSVIAGDIAITELKTRTISEKEMICCKRAFVIVSGLSTWEEVMVYCPPGFTNERTLNQYKQFITEAMAKTKAPKKKKKKGDDDADEPEPEPMALPSVIPQKFVILVKNALQAGKERANKDASGVGAGVSKKWVALSREDKIRMYGKLQTFDGEALSGELPDGTKVCDMMHYKVILADSCSRTWKEKAKCIAEQRESFNLILEEVRNNFEPSKYGVWSEGYDFDNKGSDRVGHLQEAVVSRVISFFPEDLETMSVADRDSELYMRRLFIHICVATLPTSTLPLPTLIF